MKYKVGDKARVRSNLVVGEKYPKGECEFIESMRPFVGKEITIMGIRSSGIRYLIKGNSDYWSDEMLEDVEEDNKEEVKLEAGEWYKILNNWWGKFETIHNSGKRIKFSESITSSGRYDATPKNIDLISEIELLTDLSEIQQYLPENHPDKIKKRTKKVEDLKYPDAVHCSSKDERDLLSKHVRHKINEWNKNYPYLLIEGGNKSSPYHESDYIGYINYEFSDIIFPEEKVEAKPILSKEELLAEAKRRYPVGTKYKCANGMIPISPSLYFEILDGDKLKFYGSEQMIDAFGRGFVYYGGKWAEIISKPAVEESLKYVECIGLEETDVVAWSQKFTVGEIYSVEEDDGTTIFKINGTWCDKSQFKPSTKEAFDKQNESGIKKREKLVQTGLSQSQACDSCKYNDNCGEKGFFCSAHGGQHYPKDYVPGNRTEGYMDKVPASERLIIHTGNMGLLRGVYNIPVTPKDCFESDEIYVPIIKTEVKQIKL